MEQITGHLEHCRMPFAFNSRIFVFTIIMIVIIENVQS